MAKVIKFNMMVDGVSVRTMEELIEHFNISDVVELYESGTLLRWLQARDYLDHAEKLLQIDTAAPLEEKAKALCSAFGFAPEETQRAISDMLHTRQREAALKEYAQDAASVDKIIENYLADYEKLKEDIKAHASDEDFIKSAVDQLAAVYQPILQRDCKHFYTELKDSKQDYSLITKQLRLNQTTKGYLLSANTNHTANSWTVPSSTDFSMLIKNMMEEYSTDIIALKKAADKIAQKYMQEFKIYWKPLFNKVKDTYPLIFYGLCMNKHINTFIFENKHDWMIYNDFLDITGNIEQQCSKYLKRVTNTRGNGEFIAISQTPVLVIHFNNAEIQEIPNGNESPQRLDKYSSRNLYTSHTSTFKNLWTDKENVSGFGFGFGVLPSFSSSQEGNRASLVLFNSLKYVFHNGGGEIVYMEVPETDESTQS